MAYSEVAVDDREDPEERHVYIEVTVADEDDSVVLTCESEDDAVESILSIEEALGLIENLTAAVAEAVQAR